MQQTRKQQNIEQIIEFMKIFPDGCSSIQMREHLQKENDKPITLKTIQNYLFDLKSDYVKGIEVIDLKKGYYKIIDHRISLDKSAVETEKKVYLKLALEVLEGLNDISRHHDEIIDDLKLKKLNTAYYIKPEEYEKLDTDEEATQLLEDAILEDAVIIFSYKGKYYHVEPYRLVNFDGIWYLYGKDKEERINTPYKTWMLEFIDNVEIDLLQKHNVPDELIERQLDEADSAMSIIGEQFDVHLRVSSDIADIFQRRNHLPNQICNIQEDGSLFVTSTISSYHDIDPDIKSWLPHIEILEPLEYRNQFLLELESYRNYFIDEIEELKRKI